jgi:hypothetical protein
MVEHPLRQAPAMACHDTVPGSLHLAADATLRLGLPLDARHRWYDRALTLPDQPACLRPWAGHGAAVMRWADGNGRAPPQRPRGAASAGLVALNDLSSVARS